ncbi:hypothetical protein PFISCL1PPCAC_25106, partial [Pristionchus fissidentatus]
MRVDSYFLDELLSPLPEAVEGRLGVVRRHSGLLLNPLDEELLVLFQQEELTEEDTYLIETGLRELGSISGTDAGNGSDFLLTHRLSNEVTVLHRGRRHLYRV